MGVYEKLDEMCIILTGSETSQRISERVRLYTSGAKAKLKNAEYALAQIGSLYDESDFTSTSGDQDFSISDKLFFYVDSFFAFLYSSFDVISQVINQKKRIGEDEKEVSFKVIKRRLNQTDPLKNLFEIISNKLYFKNLVKYRNCSTHRRQIYIQTIIVKIQETPDYNVTGDITRVRRILCDDPLSLNPTIDQNRELITYCTEMLNKVKLEIINISDNI